MSTAVVCAYTSEGFVIGTDGRRIDSQNGSVAEENVKKLFSINKSPSRMAFAWCGMTHIVTSVGVLDFSEVTKDLLRDIEWNDFSECLTAFVGQLSMALRRFEKKNDNFVARALFVAYFHSRPYVGEISVSRDDEGFLKVEIATIGSPNEGGINVFSGCKKIAVPNTPHCLEEAMDVVEEYIQSCIDDPECEDIGGRIQMGTLTPEGFNWIRMP
jgi:hypothetical protein